MTPLINRTLRIRVGRLVLWGVLIFLLVGGTIAMIRMPGETHRGPLPPLTPSEIELKIRLERHVGMLAGEIGERNLWRYDSLNRAADYIDSVFRDAGYRPEVDEFTVQGRQVKNVWVQLPGWEAEKEIFVVGAHYDSVLGSPGANDNASGTAAVMEMARLMREGRPRRSIRFVAFVNEEPPFYLTEQMGSRVHAASVRRRGERVIGMFSIETIGFYSDEAGSQHYPAPFSLFYPGTANFIGFVGNLSSRDLVHRAVGSFRRHTRFPSEGVSAPGWLTGIGWSDHWSFWKEGYSAIMVTDTALFRYAPYHTAGDTPERLDYGRAARVVSGLARVVAELVDQGR